MLLQMIKLSAFVLFRLFMHTFMLRFCIGRFGRIDSVEKRRRIIDDITVTLLKPDIQIPQQLDFRTYLCPVFEWSAIFF
jgi:hypothetical protein